MKTLQLSLVMVNLLVPALNSFPLLQSNILTTVFRNLSCVPLLGQYFLRKSYHVIYPTFLICSIFSGIFYPSDLVVFLLTDFFFFY
ncbi:hypothetical protein GLOIN_2v1688970 [Rhizophagus irregularis DAOM 181602=DAOM 197198]|uniref:Uncharacterized protein n=1 Tax=Rhizophagus irregularis (strain DAOM 181602 / DAOM 197198 / MUCL 43194) TaxID=747089 RepID=A0A2P4PCV3_RHIID|nr:hypothetical protein GLOIN_2v1688970 [Rhizophagus irregularis DAOM 181602=DAOM 197198]POG63177.1 hypothetical protein GLOIN_2v1688970 [Rhizophagus irregularis DAOM 181602=DAOM 197198]|eukprot:XP_025170043.1 hypothetical protein GLOIN_2v1688970 [Rhizophagus irregularis DAOM 181602=DAOM 197198]